MNLKQLFDMVEMESSDIELANEVLAAEIQRLDGTTDPALRRRLSELQAKLFTQNAGLVVNVAQHYNRGKQPTPDQTSELALAVFEAARKYDPSRGSKFSSCLAFYVKSALQKEHSFAAGHSQSVYARNKAKLNNPERYSREEISRAEALLRSKKVFSEETDSRSIPSAEDLLFALTGKTLDEAKNDRRLTLLFEALDQFPERERAVVDAMLQPARAVTEYGLSTNDAIARKLHLSRATVEIESQRISATIQDYIFENEPSFAPEDWTPEQKGIRLPGRDDYLLGLYGMLTAEEVANYKKVAGTGAIRSNPKAKPKDDNGNNRSHAPESAPRSEDADADRSMRPMPTEDLFSSIADVLDAGQGEKNDHKRPARIGRIRI